MRALQVHVPSAKDYADQKSFIINTDSALEPVWCDALIDYRSGCHRRAIYGYIYKMLREIC